MHYLNLQTAGEAIGYLLELDHLIKTGIFTRTPAQDSVSLVTDEVPIYSNIHCM